MIPRPTKRRPEWTQRMLPGAVLPGAVLPGAALGRRLGATRLGEEARRASANPPLGPALHQCWPRHTGRAWRHAGARAVHEERQGRSGGADLPPAPPRARLARTNRGRGATLPARRLQPCVQPGCNPTFSQGCNPTRAQAATLRGLRLQPYVASGCNPTCAGAPGLGQQRAQRRGVAFAVRRLPLVRGALVRGAIVYGEP